MKKRKKGMLPATIVAASLAAPGLASDIDVPGWYAEAGGEQSSVKFDFATSGNNLTRPSTGNIGTDKTALAFRAGYRAPLGAATLDISARHAGTAADGGLQWSDPSGNHWTASLSSGDSRSIDVALGVTIEQGVLYASLGLERIDFKLDLTGPVDDDDDRARWSSSHTRHAIGAIMSFGERWTIRTEISRALPRGRRIAPDGSNHAVRLMNGRMMAGKIMLGVRF